MKTDDPRDRMGVYKTLEQVPDERRLQRFNSSYANRNVWAEYVNAEDPSESKERRLGRCGHHFKDYMAECGRHHALAVPEDIEMWSESLLDEFAKSTAYSHYWNYVKGFYSWLYWHVEHPHVYNPVLMAILENPNGVSSRIWGRERGRVSEIRRDRDE